MPAADRAGAPAEPPGGDTVAAAPRQWTAGGVDSALERMGAQARPAGTVRQPFLSVPGTRFVLAAGELQVYLYGDAAARGRDTDVLDSARAAPRTMQILWRMPPTLITNNNLAAVLLTRDSTTRQRVITALTAHDRATGGVR